MLVPIAIITWRIYQESPPHNVIYQETPHNLTYQETPHHE